MHETRPSIDIIVPEFNELSKLGDEFDVMFRNFEELAGTLEVFLVDDASTDGSWERMAEVGRKPDRLHLMRMERNGQKVLAVKRAVASSRADYVLLTDFDSSIVNPEDIPRALLRFAKFPNLAGVALRMVPEGGFAFSRFQDIEFAIARGVLGRYMCSQGSLSCLPGAASIWKRGILLDVLHEHSGRHNGDDFEATIIALRMGFSTQYEPSIIVRTKVPRNTTQLLGQRTRWQLGVLETYERERAFCIRQAKNLRSRLGHVVIVDCYAWISTLLLPAFFIYWLIYPLAALGFISVQLGAIVASCILARRELLDRKNFALLPLFPFYALLATVPRLAAVYRFIKGRPVRRGLDEVTRVAFSRHIEANDRLAEVV